MQLITIVLFWLFFGLLASHCAKKRGRHPAGWFMIGLFLGIFGILLLFFLPKIEKKKELPAKTLRPVFPKRSESWLKMWYVLDPSHAQHGPYEFPDVIKKWKENGINEKSFIWGEGMTEWKRLSELPELIKEIEQATI